MCLLDSTRGHDCVTALGWTPEEGKDTRKTGNNLGNKEVQDGETGQRSRW